MSESALIDLWASFEWLLRPLVIAALPWLILYTVGMPLLDFMWRRARRIR